MKIPDIKMNVYRIICYSVKYHGHTFGLFPSLFPAIRALLTTIPFSTCRRPDEHHPESAVL